MYCIYNVVVVVVEIKFNLMDDVDRCSSNHVHWPEPGEGSRAVVDNVGDGGLHALSSHHRAAPRDPRLHQRAQAEE